MAHVQIGRNGARLTHIDGKVARYVDESGRSHEVALRAIGRHGPGYIGTRKLDEAPWFVTLEGDPPVTFEFEGYDEAYELLLVPLSQHGLHTFDLT